MAPARECGGAEGSEVEKLSTCIDNTINLCSIFITVPVAIELPGVSADPVEGACSGTKMHRYKITNYLSSLHVIKFCRWCPVLR